MESGSSSTDRSTVIVRVFWVTVGRGPQCCNGETFGPPIKGCILYCKRVGGLVGWLVGRLVSSFSCYLFCILLDSCRSRALFMLLTVIILM